jgi:hypothetical protein
MGARCRLLGLVAVIGALMCLVCPEDSRDRVHFPNEEEIDKTGAHEIDTSNINFDREIKPILAAHCYACHGPGGKSKGGLRLDVREKSIRSAIVPGRSNESPLVERITTKDPHGVMPPRGVRRTALTVAEIDLLRRWIDEGAHYGKHWAFSIPRRPRIPNVHRIQWVRNPIDAFIATKYEKLSLSAAPEADRITLVRRLSFDLTGLPPTLDEVKTFVNDSSLDAYEKVVDRLLASKHFGERMAVYWLDLVRYADTDGYSMDKHRDMWMYRDYVIDSFNQNRRFDQFTIQQLAGDLLPHPTLEDRIASGYNRLLMTSQEGCSDPKEYLARYAADRVRNVSSVWLGITMGCAECHDHKFDPFTSKDFYRLAAFFADIQEKGVGQQTITTFPTSQQKARLEDLEKRIAALKDNLARHDEELARSRILWEARIKRGGTSKLPADVADALAINTADRNPVEDKTVKEYYRRIAPELAIPRQSLAAMERDRDTLARDIPATFISTSGPLREVRILPRGDWTDKSGEVVDAGVPLCLGVAPNVKRRLTRLDLANWLVSGHNPLVARVFMNRLWKLSFGKGLVDTVEDFGTHGSAPTHPELLDWLAVEFVDRGWDVKAMFKIILMSNTYRQSSDPSAQVLECDPTNRFLARQNSFRLDAEFIRDNALCISGILSLKVGGRSVKPYQPDGYWAARFTEKRYRPDIGGDQHRRGLYTYWCRNYLHPAMMLFDAPARQSCTAERVRSSTPLQALALLNDPTQVEAARALARRIVIESGSDFSSRLDYAFRLALSRNARPDEQRLLRALFDKHRLDFSLDESDVEQVVGDDAFLLPLADRIELAAWTSVARVVLNLYEAITRR